MKRYKLFFFGILITGLISLAFSDNSRLTTFDKSTYLQDTIVYYNPVIQNIFSAKCATSRCHDAKSAKEEVILNNYENTVKTLRLSKSTDPQKNILAKVIMRNKMPPVNHTQLTNDEKELVYTWLRQGMKKEQGSAISQ